VEKKLNFKLKMGVFYPFWRFLTCPSKTKTAQLWAVFIFFKATNKKGRLN